MNIRKRCLYGTVLITLLLLCLPACAKRTNETNPSPNPSDQLPTATSDPIRHIAPPIDELKERVSVPDFLTNEQQTTYLRAYSLYSHTFAGETDAIEYVETMELSSIPPADYETVTINERPYLVSQGRYAKWDDFNAVIRAVFTDDFWKERNTSEDGTEVFTESQGRLCFMDASNGGGWRYNENFQDEFRLIEITDTTISFVLIGHYSDEYPQDGETGEQFEARRKATYDYTVEFPMEMILQDGVWKFSGFHLANVYGLAEKDDFLSNAVVIPKKW